MVNDAQVRLLRQKMKENKPLETAAAAAGMSARTAQRWKTGPLPSEKKGSRAWRTRQDPFEEVWEKDVVPLLEADTRGRLEAKTVLAELMRRDPSRFAEGQLRTLQRRFRDWRAVQGPGKEVFFPQEHPPGREAAIDFTNANELGVTIAGEPLEHLLFQLVLSHSGWTWANVAFTETFEALIGGLQRGLWKLGGVPQVVRSDNLSAATHELKRGDGRTLAKRFRDVCDHLGIEKVTRIQPGKSHENGVVEQRNYRTKRLLEQALQLRGSGDFESIETYQRWLESILDRENEKRAAQVATELPLLRKLPHAQVPAYTVSHPVVRKWSTATVGSNIYSVPSRLIGFQVEARQHADTVEFRYREELVGVAPRIRGQYRHRIDYRHVIESLVRKPGAFARYRFRDDLFPGMVFRRAYDKLVETHGDRADVEYVRILHLAATTMECRVEGALQQLLHALTPFDYAAVQSLVEPPAPERPVISIAEPDLSSYDSLLGGAVA